MLISALLNSHCAALGNYALLVISVTGSGRSFDDAIPIYVSDTPALFLLG